MTNKPFLEENQSQMCIKMQGRLDLQRSQGAFCPSR